MAKVADGENLAELRRILNLFGRSLHEMENLELNSLIHGASLTNHPKFLTNCLEVCAVRIAKMNWKEIVSLLKIINSNKEVFPYRKEIITIVC